ncbi:MAG TPA: hypothetical protein VLA04_01445 [Verrucomicrobiae bacterium]|nr:hypothetical protein [Verrucomicrobiae bacterium]
MSREFPSFNPSTPDKEPEPRPVEEGPSSTPLRTAYEVGVERLTNEELITEARQGAKTVLGELLDTEFESEKGAEYLESKIGIARASVLESLKDLPRDNAASPINPRFEEKLDSVIQEELVNLEKARSARFLSLVRRIFSKRK